jgi:hypothetical protein
MTIDKYTKYSPFKIRFIRVWGTLFLIVLCFVSTAQVDTIKTSKERSEKDESVVNSSLNDVNNIKTETFFPTITFQNPLSPGTFGSVVLGGIIENKTRIANYPDANVAAYIGLGRPEKLIGAGVTINIYGLSSKLGQKDNIGQGSLNFHLNKLFLNQKLLIDAGVDNAVFWGGDLDQDYISYQRSFYFSGNYLFQLRPGSMQKPFSFLSITAGAGNGNYRTDKHYTSGKSGSFDPFLSLATPIFKGTNIIGEWNGYDIGTGISSIPFQKIPFMFTLEVTDLVFGNPRTIASISLPLRVKKSKKTGSDVQARPSFVKPIRAVRTI